MAGQDVAQTIFKVDTTELAAAFGQVDKIYDQLEGRVKKVEQSQQTWSGTVLKNLDEWLHRIVNVKNVLGGLVSALREAADANRALLDASTETTLRRQEAFEEFQKWTGIQRGTPEFDKYYGAFSQLAEQYAAPGGQPQVSRFAGHMISQGYDLKNILGPEGWLEQGIQYQISTGKWQQGDSGESSAKALGRIASGSETGKPPGSEHTGAGIHRLAKGFYSVRESAVTGAGMEKFANQWPAIQAFTGDDLESGIATFSVLADTMDESRAAIAYRNITQFLVTSGAFKKKTAALATLGMTPKDVDFIEARLNPPKESSEFEKYVSERSAMTVVMERLAAAKKTVPQQTFNMAMAQVFGQYAISAEEVLTSHGELHARRQKQTHDPAAGKNLQQGIQPFMESKQALMNRSKESMARQLDRPAAVQISATAEFAKAAALKRNVPAAIAEDFAERFKTQATNIWHDKSLRDSLRAAAESKDTLDRFFSNASFGQFFKDMAAQTGYSTQLRESAAEALRQGEGGLSFAPVTLEESKLKRASDKATGIQKLVLNRISSANVGDEDTVESLVERAAGTEKVLMERLPERLHPGGKWAMDRMENVDAEIFESAHNVARNRSRKLTGRQADADEQTTDQLIKGYERTRIQSMQSIQKAIDYDAEQRQKEVSPSTKRDRDELRRRRDLLEQLEKRSESGSRRGLDRDPQHALAAAIETMTASFARPQRVVLDYGGPQIAARKSVLGVAMG